MSAPVNWKIFNTRATQNKTFMQTFLQVLVFSTYKIKNIFSFKDPIPDALKSFPVYQFNCAPGCTARCIGETSCHFSTRIKEHVSSDKNSHIYKYLNNSADCKSKYTSECFKILDSAKTTCSLKLKEALYIKSEKSQTLMFNTSTLFSTNV